MAGRFRWLQLLLVVVGLASPATAFTFDPQTCLPCHGSSVSAGGKWDAAGIYPELDASVLGDGTRLPLDTTVYDWKVWQGLLQSDHADKDQTCLDCHRADEPGPVVALPGASTKMNTQHRWMHTPDTWIAETIGLWVDVDAYGTFLVATVKVLNYHSGHRSPVRGRYVLVLEGVDASGQPLSFMRGHEIPDHIRDLAGRPGFVYERLYADAKGTLLDTAEGASQVVKDTRLHGDEHDEFQYYYRMPDAAPRGTKPWTISAKLYWMVNGKKTLMESAFSDTAR